MLKLEGEFLGSRHITTKSGRKKEIFDIYCISGLVRVMGDPGLFGNVARGDTVIVPVITNQLVFAEDKPQVVTAKGGK